MFDWIKKGIPAPDPGWLPFMKLMFGFGILVVLATLAMIIAIAHVKADSSFGLEIILGGLLTLSGGFAGWAFRDPKQPEGDEKEGATHPPPPL